jgi:hypothetical protein
MGRPAARSSILGHPGRLSIDGRACGSCRSRGRPERAHRSLENHRTVFHKLPQAVSFTNEKQTRKMTHTRHQRRLRTLPAVVASLR